MKRIKLLFLVLLWYVPVFSQGFDGLYIGPLFSEKNAIAMRTTGSVVMGTVFINEEEKFIFFGEINGVELTGSLIYASETWGFIGNLAGDSLLLSLTSNKVTNNRHLKKISSNPAKNPSKFLGPVTKDMRLVGEWTLVKKEDNDGLHLGIDEKTAGMTYVILADGTFYIRFPYLIKMAPNFDFSKNRYTWSTDDSKFTKVDMTYREAITSEFEIKADTLILMTKTEKMYLRKGRR